MITEVRGNGAIVVNREGNRFYERNHYRDKGLPAILQQKGESALSGVR